MWDDEKIRLVAVERPLAMWSNVTGRWSLTASHSAPNAGSCVVSRGSMPRLCLSSSWSESGGAAALSFSKAPAAAPARAALCQTRDAMPSTAASSASSLISGSS